MYKLSVLSHFKLNMRNLCFVISQSMIQTKLNSHAEQIKLVRKKNKKTKKTKKTKIYQVTRNYFT